MNPAISPISRIVVDFDHNGDPLDVTFYFLGSDEPFNSREFQEGSRTRQTMESIEELLLYGSSKEPKEVARTKIKEDLGGPYAVYKTTTLILMDDGTVRWEAGAAT